MLTLTLTSADTDINADISCIPIKILAQTDRIQCFFNSFLILQIMPAHNVAYRKQEDLPEHPGKLYYAHYMCRWCQNAHYNKWSFRESGFQKNCAALWEYTLTNPAKLKRSIGISFTAQKTCASTVATFSCWDGWYLCACDERRSLSRLIWNKGSPNKSLSHLF